MPLALLSRVSQYLQRGKSKPTGQAQSLPAISPAQSLLQRLGEYNPKVQGREWFAVVDKMRNNSRIMALEYILTLPIVATHWEVYAPKWAGASAREAADLLNKDLLERSKTTLHELLRLGVLARFYGFRAMEPVWGIDSGRVHLVDIADIHPQTIARVEFDERGAPQQLVQRVVGAGYKQAEVALEWADLLVFTWRREGGDPLGYADLRPLYPDWYRLEFLYSVLGVAAERAGIGAWSATLPRNLYDNEQLRREMVSILKSIRSYEGGALILPEGVSVEVLRAIEHQGIDAILRIAQHYETNLATAILANILQLGMRDVGTQALATVLFDMFLLQLNHTARWLADAINTQLVRRWMAYNYPQLPPEQHPNLQYTDLRLLLKREAVVDAVVKAVQAGVMPPDAGLEDYLRDLLSLPPRAGGGGRVLQNLALTPDPSAARGRGESVALTPDPSAARGRGESVALDSSPAPSGGGEQVLLARGREDAEASEAGFERAMREYLGVVEASLGAQVEGWLRRAREAEDEESRGEAIRGLAMVGLPPEAEARYTELVYSWLRRFAVEARAALARDYNRAIEPESLPESLDAYLQSKARALARDHVERLRAGVVYAALSEALKATPVLTGREIVRNIASQRVNTDLGRLGEEAQLLLERANEQLGGGADDS